MHLGIMSGGSKTADITPSPSWKNGFFESIDVRFRGEPLAGDIFYWFWDAPIVINS